MKPIQPILAAALLAASLTPAATQQAELPPWNIGGSDWRCVQQCAPGATATTVIQTGRRFVFINEKGVRSDAEWMGGAQISFIGCDNNAIVSADLRRLEFVFGSVWAR
jgi:hypothetical protein